MLDQQNHYRETLTVTVTQVFDPFILLCHCER